MAEIIVEAARELYSDEEWAEIAQERITRCRDCAKRERNQCLWFRNWGHDFNGYCAWGESHD